MPETLARNLIISSRITSSFTQLSTKGNLHSCGFEVGFGFGDLLPFLKEQVQF